jgi:hypothetical protein
MQNTRIEEKTTQRNSPPRRWRNRYWFARQILLPDTSAHPGGPHGPGILVSRRIWPSKDVAESKALESLKLSLYRKYVTYLGAEPVE